MGRFELDIPQTSDDMLVYSAVDQNGVAGPEALTAEVFNLATQGDLVIAGEGLRQGIRWENDVPPTTGVSSILFAGEYAGRGTHVPLRELENRRDVADRGVVLRQNVADRLQAEGGYLNTPTNNPRWDRLARVRLGVGAALGAVLGGVCTRSVEGVLIGAPAGAVVTGVAQSLTDRESRRDGRRISRELERVELQMIQQSDLTPDELAAMQHEVGHDRQLLQQHERALPFAILDGPALTRLWAGHLASVYTVTSPEWTRQAPSPTEHEITSLVERFNYLFTPSRVSA